MLKKYAEEIEQFMPSVVRGREDSVMPTRSQFTRLLSSPAAARRVPGIPERMNEDGEYICNEKEAAIVKEFLMQMFRIDSRQSLIEYQKEQFRSSVEYEQFMTFWKGAPLFDINELNPNGRQGFEYMINLAKPFYPMLQEKGFYAWDISEYISICRTARACGIIDEKEFDGIVDRFVRKAQVFYHSFEEYAVSYICGAMYFSAANFRDQSGLGQFFEIQKRLLKSLFDENGDWCYYKWYVPEEREWVDVYPANFGCCVTKAALEKGIEYMQRNKPLEGKPDCGWCFFHGDETDEYVNDPDNLQIVSINTVCNLKPTVLALLEAPIGSAYGWNGEDWIKEK